jgi:hypothetical protein
MKALMLHRLSDGSRVLVVVARANADASGGAAVFDSSGERITVLETLDEIANHLDTPHIIDQEEVAARLARSQQQVPNAGATPVNPAGRRRLRPPDQTW